MGVKELVKKCAASTMYCSIASAGNGGVWISPVAFATDSKFDVYFVSSPRSRHMKNISKSGGVAVAIYNTAQKALGGKIGVQMEGKAKPVKDMRGIENAYRIYFSKLPEWPKTDVSYFKDKNCEWPFVKITAKAVYYFDSDRFGDRRVKVK